MILIQLEDQTTVNDEGLPEGMEYDKAGNIVPVETQS